MTLPQLHENLQAIKPAPEFDVLFAPHMRGYLGADCALSIPVDSQRVAWIFGDTLVGHLENGRRIMKAMPRNTVAMQNLPIRQQSPEILWRGTDEKPETFLTLPEVHPDEWFWAGTGVTIDGTLFIFGYGVVHAKGSCEALCFNVRRNWLLRVPNSDDDPLNWQIDAEPFSDIDSALSLATAHYLDAHHLYLVGLRRTPGAWKNSAMVLARLARSSLHKPNLRNQVEFWSGQRDGWSTETSKVEPLFRPAITEGSLYYDAPRKRFVATTFRSHTPEFMITTAPEITGPWSEPVVVFHAPDHAPVEDNLSYAFRIHPHLSSDPDSIILTYVVNGRTLAPLLETTRLYYPRFLRLDLTAI